ncbi:hypothetical protein P7K49_029953 [Saguinus oedipus]|uniref:Uncharacterized protein n=1 Tax=Saguinus oedipus TaxID=9490 RepID=A0ABQ9U8N1_SAGOE|nr:hypothetical protein P7K49_029953 [Saguinus oedipus]
MKNQKLGNLWQCHWVLWKLQRWCRPRAVLEQASPGWERLQASALVSPRTLHFLGGWLLGSSRPGPATTQAPLRHSPSILAGLFLQALLPSSRLTDVPALSVPCSQLRGLCLPLHPARGLGLAVLIVWPLQGSQSCLL